MLHKWNLAGVAMIAAACTFVYSTEHTSADVSISVGTETGGIKAPDDGKVSINFFYDALAPYGTWVQDQKHGWVWQPQVVTEVKEWRPYFNDGHWILTDQGWFWKSNYEWGWISFHYGRWYFRENAWVWVPDTTWAPAWVAWRESDNVFGWAPLPPEATYEVNVGVTIREELPADYFVFVPSRSFLSVNLTNVALPRTEVRTVYNRTEVIKNTYVTENNRIINRGIPAERVTRATGQQVDTVKLTEANVQGGQAITGERMQGNQMVIYRPQVSKEAGKAEPSAAARESKQQKQSGKMSADTSRSGKQPQDRQQARDTQAQPGKEGRSQAQPKQDQQPMNTAADQKSDRASATDAPNRSHAPNAPKPDAPGRDMKAGANDSAGDRSMGQRSTPEMKRDAEKPSGVNRDAAKPSDRANDRSAIDRQDPAMNTSADRARGGSGDRMTDKPAGDPRRDNPSRPSANQPGKPDVPNPNASSRGQSMQDRSSAQPSSPSPAPASSARDARSTPSASSPKDTAAKPPKGSSSDAPASSQMSGADRSGSSTQSMEKSSQQKSR